MRSAWAWILCGIGAVLVCIVVVVRLAPGGTAAPIGNPLLTVDKANFRRFFPGFCFDEIYRFESFGGSMVKGCVQRVIESTKAETGIVLTPEQLRSPEVLAHLKRVFGGRDWKVQP